MAVEPRPNSACSVEGCDSPTRCRGVCTRHYARLRRHGDPTGGTPETLAGRLEAKVDRSGGPDACWPFTAGHATRSGHRQMWWEGRMHHAHRLAWMVANGPIPEGEVVRHRCDNPPCCNPAHLQLGTVADNNRDREERGRGVLPRPDQVRRQAAGQIVHGTIYAYVKRKCRCDECRQANRDYRSKRKASS